MAHSVIFADLLFVDLLRYFLHCKGCCDLGKGVEASEILPGNSVTLIFRNNHVRGRPFIMCTPGGEGQDPIRFSYLHDAKKCIQGERGGQISLKKHIY